MKRFGFTLAEVLITLGIIGVVAAMTIPTLMQKINRHDKVAGVKKFYANLNNALQAATVEHGSQKNWNTTMETTTYNNEFGINGEYPAYVKYIMENMKYVKACGIGNIYETGCFAENYACTSSQMSPNLNNSTCRFSTGNNSTSFILSDGTSVAFTEGYPIFIYFDVNGKKGPNKVGEDMFFLTLDRQDYIKFNEMRRADYYNEESSGFGVGWILKNGNMDYLDE
ncbi:type II secretion system protein [bacterium]|nr:type II secretion system protein [bacterium]